MCQYMNTEEFVWAYCRAVKQGLTTKEFAKSINRTVSAVQQRAYELRKGGVKLPALRRVYRSGPDRFQVAKQVLKAAKTKGLI